MRGEEKGRLQRLQEANERRRKYTTLRKDALRKVAFLIRKPVIDAYEVYNLVKEFFAGYLEQEHEFTINELREELRHTYISNHTRSHIDLILERLHQIEYQDLTVSHDEMLQVLNSFTDIVKQLVRTQTKKKGLYAKLISFLMKEEIDPATIIAELPVVEPNDEENIRIHILIERCYAALEKHKMHKAKASYKALMEEYQSLPTKEKNLYYELLVQTHKDILNRAKP